MPTFSSTIRLKFLSTSGVRSCPPAAGGGRRRLCRLGELCPSSAGTHWAWPDGRQRKAGVTSENSGLSAEAHTGKPGIERPLPRLDRHDRGARASRSPAQSHNAAPRSTAVQRKPFPHQAGAVTPHGQPRWQRVAAGLWKPVLNIIGISAGIAVFPPSRYYLADYV